MADALPQYAVRAERALPPHGGRDQVERPRHRWEHRAIVEAVLAGDAEQATREMARHIERTIAAIAAVHR